MSPGWTVKQSHEKKKKDRETFLSTVVHLKIIKIQHYRLLMRHTSVLWLLCCSQACPEGALCTVESCKQTKKRCLHSPFLIRSQRVCPRGAERISFNIQHLQSRYSTSTSSSSQSSSPQCLLMHPSQSETASSKMQPSQVSPATFRKKTEDWSSLMHLQPLNRADKPVCLFALQPISDLITTCRIKSPARTEETESHSWGNSCTASTDPRSTFKLTHKLRLVHRLISLMSQKERYVKTSLH